MLARKPQEERSFRGSRHGRKDHITVGTIRFVRAINRVNAILTSNALETSDTTRLIAREDFIANCCRDGV
jgi:hypothetical protein